MKYVEGYNTVFVFLSIHACVYVHPSGQVLTFCVKVLSEVYFDSLHFSLYMDGY